MRSPDSRCPARVMPTRVSDACVLIIQKGLKMKYSLLTLGLTVCGFFVADTARAALQQPGFRFGRDITMNPVVNVGAFWESNARNTAHNEKSGAGWRVQPAVSFGFAANRTTVGLNLYYTLERGFDSDNGQDSDSYGESLSINHRFSNKLSFSVSQFYRHSENDQFQPSFSPYAAPTVDTDESDSYGLTLGLGYTPNGRWNFSGTVGWTRTDYDNRGNGSYDGDSDTLSFSVMAGRAVFGGRANWNTSFSVSVDDPADGDKSTSYNLMTGYGAPLSAKLSWNAMVGVGIYDYSGYNDDLAVGPSYSISGAWRINRRMALSLALSSNYSPEYSSRYAQRSYYIWNHSLTAGFNYQWDDVNNTRLDVALRYEEHVNDGNYDSNGNAGQGGGDYERTYFNVRLSHSYAFSDHVSLYGSVSYNTDLYSGRDTDDTDDVRLDIGLSFKF